MATTTYTFDTPGSYTWVPDISGRVRVRCIGAGGGGGPALDDPGNNGGGGGGGAWAEIVDYPVTNGVAYSVVVGYGGLGGNDPLAMSEDGLNGGESRFVDNLVTRCKALGGYGGTAGFDGGGGVAGGGGSAFSSIGTTKYDGGDGVGDSPGTAHLQGPTGYGAGGNGRVVRDDPPGEPAYPGNGGLVEIVLTFDALYGSETSTSSETAAVDVIDESCLAPLQALLPPGVAWTRDVDATLTQLLRALGYEFSRVRKRARDLLEEVDPSTTVELLADWEALYGLDGTGLTLAERRAQLLGRVRGFGDPTRQYFIDLAAALGYAITILEYTPDDVFTCTSACTDALYDFPWLAVWDVTTASGSADAQLQAAIEALAPVHTLPRFTFT